MTSAHMYIHTYAIEYLLHVIHSQYLLDIDIHLHVICMYLNQLTPGAFCQKTHVLDILEIFNPEMGQISSNLLKKAFLSTKTTFYDIFARTCAEIKILRWTGKWPTSLDFSFLFICFLPLSFFSFFYLFAAVIDLLLGLLPVERILRKHDYRDRQILPWSSRL